MGKSHGADTPRGSSELQSGDYFDPGKLKPLGPDTSNTIHTVDQMKPVSGGNAKAKKAAGAIGSAIAQAGAAMDQQPQQVQAGPQIGQAQQAPMVDQGQPLDYLAAYKRNLMYGNSFYGE